MNITLSAEKVLIQKARDYAKRHKTSLNQLIRDYLRQVVGDDAPEMVAEMFAKTAKENAGMSKAGYRFDRDSIHRFDEK